MTKNKASVGGSEFESHEAGDAAPGCLILKAPKGVMGCSYEGVEYEVKDGLVEVPAEAAEGLIAKHGFTKAE